MHFLLLWAFGLLIFYIMSSANKPLPGVKNMAISEEERIRLIYRLQVLTMIVWLLLFLMIVAA
jgi:hypothetical protein